MAGRTRSRTPPRHLPLQVTICVRDLGGNFICEVSMPTDKNAAYLYRTIQDVQGTDECLQKLVFNGTALDGTHTLQEYGLHQNAEIVLIHLERTEPNIYSVRAQCELCLLERYCEETPVEEEDQHWIRQSHTYYCQECSDKALELARRTFPALSVIRDADR